MSTQPRILGADEMKAVMSNFGKSGRLTGQQVADVVATLRQDPRVAEVAVDARDTMFVHLRIKVADTALGESFEGILPAESVIDAMQMTHAEALAKCENRRQRIAALADAAEPLSAAEMNLLANKKSDTISDDEVARLIAALRRDPRVTGVEFDDGKYFTTLRIKATDTGLGESVDGVFSVGRIIKAMASTWAECQAAEERSRRYVAERTERNRIEAEQREADRQRAKAEYECRVARLAEKGITLQQLRYVADCLRTGRYIAPKDAETFGFYSDTFAGGVWRTNVDAVLRGEVRV